MQAVGSFEQQPGCPETSLRGLPADRLEALCRGECHHPSDERHAITAIEVGRIRPPANPAAPLSLLIVDARAAVREIERARFALQLQEMAVATNMERQRELELKADQVDAQIKLDADNELLQSRNDRDAALRDLRVAILNYLLVTGQMRVNADGTFTDVTASAGLGSLFNGMIGFAPRFADMDGDRSPELLWIGDFGTSLYFRNNADGTFTEITASTGMGLDFNEMGMTVADFNRDGRFDRYVTTVGTNDLYRNDAPNS